MMRTTVGDVADFLEKFAPLKLAESWDNVGLLIGDHAQQVNRILTCLTLTADVAEEAVDRGAEMIVSHHPILFRPVQKFTSATVEGRLVLELMKAGIAVYSPHTAFDSAKRGINQSWAEAFELREVAPLRPAEDSELQGQGAGRLGDLPAPLHWADFLEHVRTVMNLQHLQYAGAIPEQVERIGIACGSAAEFLRDAASNGCQVLITGEGRFHSCLEAESSGIAMILAGHYATERPAIEKLAALLQESFPNLQATASQNETDPVKWSVNLSGR